MQPIVLVMWLDDGMWHRCFPDAGLAFWEVWAQVVPEDEPDDAVRQVDYGREYSLAGEAIQSVEAKPSGPSAMSELTVRFTSGRFLQLCIDGPAGIDASSRIHVGAAR